MLSDCNPRLIAFHRSIRNEAGDVLAELDRLAPEPVQTKYRYIRSTYNDGVHWSARQAARFLWLNRACFNGLHRENSKGEFNTPPGDSEFAVLPTAEHIFEVSAALQSAELAVCDFREAVDNAGLDDQVYADPPYVPQKGRTSLFTEYSKKGFSNRDHWELAHRSRLASRRGASVVVSNHDVQLTTEALYPGCDGWMLVGRPKVARTVGGRHSVRGRASELLVTLAPQ